MLGIVISLVFINICANKIVMKFLFHKISLTVNTLWAKSVDNKLISFLSQSTGFPFSCKLSPLESTCMKCQSPFSALQTTCMNCQSLFSGKNKKHVFICHLLKILPRVLIYDINLHQNLSDACVMQHQKTYLWTCVPSKD